MGEAGILGENIMGSGFSFDLEIRIGAGHLSAVKKPLCWLPSRAGAANRDRSLPSPLKRLI